MLNANAARQCAVTTRRMCSSGDCHIGGLERHPKCESEIDEVPVDGLCGSRKLETGAALVRLAVRQMGVVQRIDRIAE